MLSTSFRPWGLLSWVLERLPTNKWAMVGSVATGDRSLSSWKKLKQMDLLDDLLLFQINDAPSPYWGDGPERRLAERRAEFLAEGGDQEAIALCDILDPYDTINRTLRQFIARAGENIVVDISTLPKRFFFPFVKTVLLERRFSNIIVTYTRPGTYATDKPLSIDPEPWRDLPMFKPPYPEPENKHRLVVGLGYEILGLPQLLKADAFRGVTRDFLLPFPATPSGYIRNWESIHNLESEGWSNSHEPLRINAYDVSAVFDLIVSLTGNCTEYAIFAPYGPKPMSLAMCLYASACPGNSCVYYTQPRSYNPNYSTGIREEEGNNPAIYAYCIRLNGRDLYQLK